MFATHAYSLSPAPARPALPPKASERLKSITDAYVDVVESWSCTREDVLRLSTLAADLVGLIDAAPQFCLGMGPHLPLASPSMRTPFSPPFSASSSGAASDSTPPAS
jgi:hypothetical protein